MPFDTQHITVNPLYQKQAAGSKMRAGSRTHPVDTSSERGYGDLERLSSHSITISTSSSVDKYPAKQHASRVAQALNVDHGLIVLASEKVVNWTDSDQPRPFRQLRYFFYLSGVDESDCHVTFDIESEHLTLWLPPIDPRRVVWTGRGSTTEEALRKYDVDDARYKPTLEQFLEGWIQKNKGDVYVLHPIQSRYLFSRLNTKDLQPAIDACRVIKDGHEISLIKKANHISAQAHESVLRKLHTFDNEAQVEAEFLRVSVANGCKQSYEIIAGSGSNASVLHYIKNNEDFGDRQLMCLDAGSEWQAYSSDVTRTFPLSGKWPSLEAKQIYDLVQHIQTECMKIIGPGKRFAEAYYLTHLLVIEGLLKLGVLQNGTKMEIFKAGTSVAFFPHGLGHHMGLEVHDVSPPVTKSMETWSSEPLNQEIAGFFPGVNSNEELRLLSSAVDHDGCRSLCQSSAPSLEPGMVVTVEPGIYFNREALESVFFPSPVHSKYINKSVLERYMAVGGVRIEDDLLITSSGWEKLTTAAKGEAALKIIRGEA